MDDYEAAARRDDPVESGALEGTEPGRQAGEPRDEPAEGAALQQEQQGKGYGLDEAERGGALPDE